MPSQRKRIGFLPRAEVQGIIDKICEKSKLSQSKVTGILVEEALKNRGVLNINLDNKSLKLDSYYQSSRLTTNDESKNKSRIEIDKIGNDESYLKNEIQMINDFIEFKFFKNIMNQNKNKLQN